MSTNKLPEAALFYAQRLNWSIFPLKPESKQPATAHGFKDASRDADTIRAWWQRTPNANIGFSTGDVIVLDFDAHKPDYAGAELLDMLLQEYSTPATDTARGGVHLFFAARPGLLLKNASGSLPAGVDVRGHGGYVVLPPSRFVHDGGQGVYAWRKGLEPWNAALAALPLFVVDLILAPSEAGEAGKRPDGKRADDVIAEFNRTHKIADLLTAHGYTVGRNAGSLTRLSRPGKPATDTSIVIAAVNGVERSYHHSTSDALHTDRHARDAFDVWTHLEHGGDAKAAYRAAKQAQGKWTEKRAKPTPTAATATTDAGASFGASPEFLTDMGNAARLARLHGHRLRFVDAWGWLSWDGSRWQMDATGEVMRLAKDTARSLFDEGLDAIRQAEQTAQTMRDSLGKDAPTAMEGAEAEAKDRLKKAKERLAWAIKSQDRRRLEAMIALAKSDAPIPARAADFDADPWLLNVKNGVLNLRTGELMPHAPEHLCSKLAPVTFDANAHCPTWHAFLHRIFGGDGELIDYLQRWLGYCLTGLVSEQYLHALWGSGANGKSVLIGTVLALLGDYAATAAPELLLAREGKHPTEVADLQGRRFVVSVETDEGRRLAEAAVKSLTGGDTVKARRMRQDFFEFSPTAKLVMVTNHRPRVTGSDNAIWRRLRLLPFEVTIPEAEQDKNLPAKLKAELPGILAWAVRGCLEWQRRGLEAPEKVRTATAAYRAESDHLASFLAECVTEAPGAEVQAKELYKAYVAWCDDNGQKPLSGTAFGFRLGERGFDKYTHPSTRRTYYLNLALEAE